MRFYEFNNIQIPLNNDEIAIFDKIDKSPHGLLQSETLSENEIELARKMVTRGVLLRHHSDESTQYSRNR